MKKYAVASTLIIASLSAAPAFANSSQWFVGGGIGYQNDRVEQTILNEHKKTNEDVSYQLRGGVIIDDHHRITGSYSYFEDKFEHALLGLDTKQKQQMFLASYDYLLPVHQNINLFAGVSAGMAYNKFETDFAANSSTDFVWGGQVGAQYNIGNNWSTDLTYRYLDQNYNEGMTKVDYTQQVVWSVDYKF
ncbi:outer membrane protein H1 [Photobacterium aquae]|uniref:Outer membrane protein H1 n=1 Tax=Photobacterium aquae TaxID=1195763 RepID=A0A0J1JTA1_9GAMM|nr:porin family protein [Photobacterium aquae]KLV05512.1 outer membrane protein H1 [Photobacterium aquae]